MATIRVHEEHAVIVHHCDGVLSTEGYFSTREQAIEFAMRRSQELPSIEFVSVLGYTIRGRRAVR